MTSFPRAASTGRLIATNEYLAHLLQVPANGSRSNSFSRPDNAAGTLVSAASMQDDSVRLVSADLKRKAQCDGHCHDYLRNQFSEATARSPLEWLHEVNRNRPGDCTAGIAVVDLDLENHCYRVVLADHPAPLIRPGDRAAALSLDGQFRLVAPVPSHGTSEVPWLPFEPGSFLVLPTSGVLNAGMVSRGEGFGMRRLKRAIETAHGPGEVLDSVCRDVVHHLGGHPLEDDLTLLLIARSRAQPNAPAQKSRPAA
jgi:hypothetical protein